MADIEQVKARVSTDVRNTAFVQRLAKRTSGAASAKAVFGEPVDRDGLTVIPVAKATWGFGGGTGGDATNQGAGGGGAGITRPIGFIEVRADGARFVPIRDLRLSALRLV